MKAALCFSGLPRYVKQCHSNIKTNLFSDLNPDVYVSVWDEAFNGLSYRGDLDKTRELYKPVAYDSRKQVDDRRLEILETMKHLNRADLRTIKSKRGNAIYMWESIGHCHNLVPKDTYDVVIRARTDLILNGKVIITSVEPNTLYVVGGEMPGGGLQDMLFYGDYATMSKMAELHKDILNLSTKTLGIKHKVSGINCYFSSHHIMEIYAKEQDIKVVPVKVKIGKFRDNT